MDDKRILRGERLTRARSGGLLRGRDLRRRALRGLAGAVAVLLLAGAVASATAAFRNTLTKSERFDKNKIQRIALVTVDCHEVVDCANMERRAHVDTAQAKLPFKIVAETSLRTFLFDRGETSYRRELLPELAKEFDLSAVAEISVPFAERGDGFGGRRRSSVKVELVLLDPEGRILLTGTGTGRPLNVVSGAEKVAARAVKELLEDAFQGK